MLTPSIIIDQCLVDASSYGMVKNLKLAMPPMVPLMGFAHEQYIPSHGVTDDLHGSWAAFYTCIANGKRVYVWGWERKREFSCYVMLSDHVNDPAINAGEGELQHMFSRQHKERKNMPHLHHVHKVPSDAFIVQALIHEITRGGNENVKPEAYR